MVGWWFVLLLLILLLIYFLIGTSLCRWVLHQDSFPDSIRMGAYYTGYIPMMIGSNSPDEIKTKYGFSLYGLQKESTLMKCFTLVDDYEPSLVRVMKEYFGCDTTFVDVGANEGYFTLLAAKKGCKVYAVEPSQNNLKILSNNVAKNNYKPYVTILPYAAGNKNTNVTFHESSLNGMWSSVSTGGKTNLLSSAVTVEMKCLQDIIPEIPDIVKIDVEGFEDAVIEGCLSWVIAKRTIWIIEMDDTTHHGINLLHLFQSRGYNIATLVVDSACLPGRIYELEKYIIGTTPVVGFRNFIFTPDDYQSDISSLDICTSRDPCFERVRHTLS